jgi:hypothetical protein
MPNGFNSTADLLNKTADGKDLNDLWADYQAVLAQWNAERNRMINFLTFKVTEPIEYVPVLSSSGDFQEASEYGVPVGIRPQTSYYNFGYDFKWYDLAARFTWQFLADAPQSRIDAVANQALESDNRLVYSRVMRRIFNNTNNLASISGNAYNVYTFYNGAGDPPPTYKSNTFLSTHNHFVTSGATAIDPGDLATMQGLLAEHGYDMTNGYRMVLMLNRAQADLVRLFKLGVNGAIYDFIPAQGTPAFFLPQNTALVGGQVPNTLNGFKVTGSYGEFTIIEEDQIPAGYALAFATGGADSLQNPVGIREHANESLRGMRLVKGRDSSDYPLIDSYYIRGMGTGIRHRGAGVVMQFTASGTYTPPAIYA